MSSPNEVQKKLQDYRNFIEEKFGKEYISDDQELTLMSIKSLEVSSKIKFPHLKIKMELSAILHYMASSQDQIKI